MEQLEALGLEERPNSQEKIKIPKAKNPLSEEQRQLKIQKINEMSLEELRQAEIKKYEQNNSGYKAPNGEMKDEINTLISNSLCEENKGLLVILDGPDFKTSTSIYKKLGEECIGRLVIPNNSNEAEIMKSHPIFGKCVISTSIQEYLESIRISKQKVSLVYADMTGQEFNVLFQIKKCNLEKNSIVAFTVASRSNEKSHFTNSYVSELLETNRELWGDNGDKLKNLVKQRVFVYGEHVQMATSVFRINM